jgi:hypothetical protein
MQGLSLPVCKKAAKNIGEVRANFAQQAKKRHACKFYVNNIVGRHGVYLPTRCTQYAA